MKKKLFEFNKTFFKETMRYYMVTAIVFGVLIILASISIGIQLYGNMAASMNFNIPVQNIEWIICAFMAYLGANLARKLLNKGTAELYGSMPVSRSSMWMAQLLAGICYSLMMIAIFVITMFIIRIGAAAEIGVNVGNYGYSAGEFILDICRIILEALIVFSISGISFSITGRSMTAVVTALLIVTLPGCIYGTLNMQSVANIDSLSILIPAGAGVRNALEWIVQIVLALALPILFRQAFLAIRTERAGFAYRDGTMQTIFGVIFAFDIFVSCFNTNTAIIILIGNNGTNIVGVIITAAILTFIGYFAFMWIAGRKFKAAANSLMYLPVSAALACAVLLAGSAVSKAYDRIDFSAGNMAYYTIPDYIGKRLGSDYMNNSFYFGGYNFGNDAYGKGVTNEDEIKFSDPKQLSQLAKVIERYRADNNSMFNYVINLLGSIGIDKKPSLYLTLKDGRTYGIDLSWEYLGEFSYMEAARANEEYCNAMYDLKRFEGGHFVLEDSRMNMFYDTFIDELSSLSLDQRAEIFDLSSIYMDLEMSFMDDEAIIDTESVIYENGPTLTPFARVIFIANRDNSCIRGIILNEHTPKTLKACLELSGPVNEKNGSIQYLVDTLKNGNSDGINTEFMIWDTETGRSYEYSFEYDQHGYDYVINDEYYRKMLGELLMEFFNKDINTMTADEISDGCIAMEALGWDYLYDDDYVDEGMTQEELDAVYDEIIAQGLEYARGGAEEMHFYAGLRDWMMGITSGAKSMEGSRYVLIINKCRVWSADEDGYSSWIGSIELDTASNFNHYPIVFGLSDEEFGRFYDAFYSNTEYPIYYTDTRSRN